MNRPELVTASVYAVKAVSPEFGEWMGGIFGHAWFSMRVLALALYVGLGFIGLRWTKDSKCLAVLVAGAAIMSGGARQGGRLKCGAAHLRRLRSEAIKHRF